MQPVTLRATLRMRFAFLVISDQLLVTRGITLIKHMGCVMLTFISEDPRAIVEQNLAAGGKRALDGLDFRPFLRSRARYRG